MKKATDMRARFQEKRKTAEPTHALSVFLSGLFTTPAFFISIALLGIILKVRPLSEFSPYAAITFGGIAIIVTVLVKLRNGLSRMAGYLFSTASLLICALTLGLGIYLLVFAPRLDIITAICLMCSAIGMYLSYDSLRKFKVQPEVGAA
jgi:hypothetical protein